MRLEVIIGQSWRWNWLFVMCIDDYQSRCILVVIIAGDYYLKQGIIDKHAGIKSACNEWGIRACHRGMVFHRCQLFGVAAVAFIGSSPFNTNPLARRVLHSWRRRIRFLYRQKDFQEICHEFYLMCKRFPKWELSLTRTLQQGPSHWFCAERESSLSYYLVLLVIPLNSRSFLALKTQCPFGFSFWLVYTLFFYKEPISRVSS